jgi:hypothetical protein
MDDGELVGVLELSSDDVVEEAGVVLLVIVLWVSPSVEDVVVPGVDVEEGVTSGEALSVV